MTIGDDIPQDLRDQLDRIGRTSPVPNTPHRPDQVCTCPHPGNRPYHCAADPAREQPDVTTYSTQAGPAVEHPA